MSSGSPQARENTTASAGLEFLRELSVELAAGKVDLPSFPEVAVRVRRVLSDDRSTVDQVVRIVGSEPALAARLLKMANSVALNRSGKRVTELRTAVNRMGHNMVRSAAVSFAMAQIRGASKLVGLEKFLGDLWERSTHVAAVSFLLASRVTRLNADEAMLTGLLHGIGKLYIVTRAERHPMLFLEPNSLNDIIGHWHAAIGKAILESWEFDQVMCDAVARQDEVDAVEDAEMTLADVIHVAIMLVSLAADAAALEAALQCSAAAKRLRIDAVKSAAILSESASEIASLRQALTA